MKSVTLLSTGTLCLAMLSCSTAASTPSGSAGETSSGGSGANAGTSTVGTGGSGNSTSMGGASSGGSGTSMGGSTATGGTDTATGGTDTATGGTGAGGAAGGAAGGSGGAADLLPIVGAWDGALLEYPCSKASTTGYDCSNVNCTGGTATATKMWTIGGTAGTVYNVTFRVRGVVEVTYYLNTKRDADVANNNMNTSITKDPDLFARGGTPQTNTGQSYDYNTYEMDVTPAVAGAENTYFLNSVDMNENPHAGGSTTTHLTFKIDYTKTIKVTGGGSVTLKSFDSNCALVMNCATSSQNQCATHYSVDLTGATPPAPATFMQPYSQNGGFGQWVFFDVTDVTAAP